MSFKWPNKDPDETLDYSMDWSRFLGYDHSTSSGTVIVSNLWFIDDASGVKTQISTTENTTVNGITTVFSGILRDSTNTVCTIRLSSGTLNTTYKITSQITDDTGLISERVVKLRIKEN
tara:strand:- start:5595 stop:5951 length:357 start_codon:yes stop_codon:yes gene_type:complete